MADLVAGDETKLTLTLLGRDRNAINLVGGSATLRWRIDGSTRVDSGMTLTDAANGKVQYKFQSTDLVEGRLTADVYVTTAGGDSYSNRNVLSFEVRRQV